MNDGDSREKLLRESNLNIIKNLSQKFKDIPPEELIETLQNLIDGNDRIQLSYILSGQKEISKLQSELYNDLISHSILIQKMNHSIQDNDEIFRKLKKINPEQFDNEILQNKKLALGYLEKIYEKVYIPDKIINSIQNANFNNISKLDKIYKRIKNLYNEYINRKVPEILVKMPRCFEQRQQKIKLLVDNFVINFTQNFFHQLLMDHEEIINISMNKRDNIDFKYIPNTNTMFSINISDFHILRVLFPYHKIFNFIKDNYSSYYDEIIDVFILSIKKFNDKEVYQKLNKVNKEVKLYLKTYQLNTCDYEKSLSTDDENSVFNQIKIIFNTLFDLISKENIIIEEFFNCTFQNKTILSDNFQNDLLFLINNLSSFRILYFFKIFKCFQNKYEYFQSIEHNCIKIFDKYVEKQVKYIHSARVIQNKIYIIQNITQDYIDYLIGLIKYCDNPELEKFNCSFFNLIREAIEFIHNSNTFETQRLKKYVFLLINYHEIFTKIDAITLQINEKDINIKLQNLKSNQNMLQENFLHEMLFNYIHEPFIFFDKIDCWKRNHYFQDELVLIQPTHTMKKFLQLQEHFVKNFQDGLKCCFSFLKRTIKNKHIRKEIKREIRKYLKEKVLTWNKISLLFYNKKVFNTNIENLI